MRMAGWQALAAAVRAFGADPATRVVIVRGAGEGAFSAGADIAEFPTLRSDPQTGAAYHEAVADAFRGARRDRAADDRDDPRPLHRRRLRVGGRLRSAARR